MSMAQNCECVTLLIWQKRLYRCDKGSLSGKIIMDNLNETNVITNPFEREAEVLEIESKCEEGSRG